MPARSLPLTLQHLNYLLAQAQLLLNGDVRALVALALATFASQPLAAREPPPELAQVEGLDLAISTMRYAPNTPHAPGCPISDRARVLHHPEGACVRPKGALCLAEAGLASDRKGPRIRPNVAFCQTEEGLASDRKVALCHVSMRKKTLKVFGASHQTDKRPVSNRTKPRRPTRPGVRRKRPCV